MNGNKPDWKDAPEWAKYCAMDEDGEWYWFEERPRYSEPSGVWYRDINSQSASANVFGGTWTESLEERPE